MARKYALAARLFGDGANGYVMQVREVIELANGEQKVLCHKGSAGGVAA